MQTTTVVTSGKGSNPKNTLYVGGLETTVTESSLFAAFIPFGDIREVTIPLDFTSGQHRGFGFVEYEEPDDAAAAIDNMRNAELFGRVLRVNYAQPSKSKGSEKGWSYQAVWADADKYFEAQRTSEPTTVAESSATEKTQSSEETPVAAAAAANPMAELEKALS